MSLSWEEYKTTRAVEEVAVAEHKSRMMAEVRAYRLRELREEAGRWFAV